MFYLNQVMSRLFLQQSSAGDDGIDFNSIRNMADFWKVRLSVQIFSYIQQPVKEGPSVNTEQ